MWNKKAVSGFVFLLLGLLGAFSLLSKPVYATGGINPVISFEGKIVNKTSGVNIADATYNMEFKIYSGPSNVGTGDTLLWTEDWLVGSTQGGIALSSGTYQVSLGTAGSGDSVALSSLNWNQYPLWLSVQIGNSSSCTITTNFTTNCLGDGEMSPYIQLSSTPYSFTSTQIGYTNSGFVGTLSFQSTLSGTDSVTIPDASGTICLQNATACGFAANTNSPNYIQNQSVSPQAASFEISGTSTINGLATLSGGLTINTAAASDISVTSGATVPTADQLNITNTGSSGVTTAGVNALSINYKGGAAAVESAAERIDLQPGTTSGGTWNAVRIVANGTGPATGVTETGVKVEGPTTGGAGTFNAVNVANVGAVASGGTVNGINITGTNSNAAGTENGININNLTGGAATENAINIGTGWDNILQSTYLTATGTGAITATEATPASSAGNGTSAANILSVTGGTGGSTTGAANTAGAGANVILQSGNGGSATTGTSTAGAGGSFTIQAGNGGAAGASGTNGNGGSITISAGTVGTGGSGASPGSVIIKNQTNSNTAFQIQDTSGIPIFLVDTTTNNIIVNPGFEAGVSDWATRGSSAIQQDATPGNFYFGIAALKSTLSATTSGTQTSGGQSAFTTNILASTQYQLTFEAKCSSVLNTFTYGRDDVSGTDITNTSTANCNTSWQQYTWHFTTGTTITNPLLFFTLGTASSGSFWLDSVQLVKTTISGAQPYQIGNIQLRGVVDNPATFESQSNSTTAFQILSSNDNNGTASLPLNELTVDTLNNNVVIGSQTASTNGIDLTLNNYNASLGTEPTEVNGAMYYNSTINQFRCGVNGTWENCGGLDIANTATTACTVALAATSCVPNNYFTSAAPSIPANYCTTGRVIHVFASGIYTGATAQTTIAFSVRLAGTIIGAASGGVPTQTTAGLGWNVNFYITCDSTTTVTGEGNAIVATTSAAAGVGSLVGSGTTTVTNTSAQAIALYINVGATADVSSITLEQFIVQGM